MRRVFLLILFLSVLHIYRIEASVYSKNDPHKHFKEKIEDMFNIYILNEDKRHRFEVVKYDPKYKVLELWYWQEFSRRFKKENICKSFKWLFYGRGRYGVGAFDVFKQFKEILRIKLIFYNVEFVKIVDHEKGKINRHEKIIPHIRVEITKENIEKLDEKKLLKDLSRLKGCADSGEEAVSSVWYNEKFYD